jgi:hypothetical protein
VRLPAPGTKEDRRARAIKGITNRRNNWRSCRWRCRCHRPHGPPSPCPASKLRAQRPARYARGMPNRVPKFYGGLVLTVLGS